MEYHKISDHIVATTRAFTGTSKPSTPSGETKGTNLSSDEPLSLSIIFNVFPHSPKMFIVLGCCTGLERSYCVRK